MMIMMVLMMLMAMMMMVMMTKPNQGMMIKARVVG